MTRRVLRRNVTAVICRIVVFSWYKMLMHYFEILLSSGWASEILLAVELSTEEASNKYLKRTRKPSTPTAMGCHGWAVIDGSGYHL